MTTSFSNTITRGFAAADDINTAVCTARFHDINPRDPYAPEFPDGLVVPLTRLIPGAAGERAAASGASGGGGDATGGGIETAPEPKSFETIA